MSTTQVVLGTDKATRAKAFGFHISPVWCKVVKAMKTRGMPFVTGREPGFGSKPFPG
jgi:hypothetical protein